MCLMPPNRCNRKLYKNHRCMMNMGEEPEKQEGEAAPEKSEEESSEESGEESSETPAE